MLTGSLKDLPLLGLLEGLIAAERTGVLRIESPVFSGCIYLESGQPVHAAVAELLGYRALEFIAGIGSAPFRFEGEATTTHKTLTASLETLSRLSQLFDAWQALRLPQDWGVSIRTDLLPGEASLDAQENAVLAMATGQTLAGILLASEYGPLETAKVIARLLHKSYLEAHEPISFEPEQLAVLSMYGPSKGVAIVDKALYDAWRAKFKYGFVVRVRFKDNLTTLKAESRSHFSGRLGLFETDLRQLHTRRGYAIEVWPEAV